jgi:hypothetical protein
LSTLNGDPIAIVALSTFGRHFIWVTDCHAAKFVPSNDGANPAILWLQMRLMCWDVDIINRPEAQLADADYWSRLGVNIEYNPLLCNYLEFTMKTNAANLPPTELPMRPINMSYYRGPRFQATTTLTNTTNMLHGQTIMINIVLHQDCWHTHWSNIPICFKQLIDNCSIPKSGALALLNSKFAWYIRHAIGFDWAVYLFSNGHFSSSVNTWNLPFHITLACNFYKLGGVLFQGFAMTAWLFGFGNNMLNHIRASGETSDISGYLINSFPFQISITSSFWHLQLSIIGQLCLVCLLLSAVAMVILDHDCHLVSAFVKSLTATHLKIASHDVYYPNIGNLIADSCTIIITVHTTCASNVQPID